MASSVIPFNNSHLISIKLTPNNYILWKTQISLLLMGHDLMGFVDGTYKWPIAPHPNYSQWAQQDKLIMSLLFATLSDDVADMVKGLKTSHSIWASLEQAFGPPTKNTPPFSAHIALQFNKKVHQNNTNVTPMDPDLYKSLENGDVDVEKYKNQVSIQLTPNGNTLLHVLAQFRDSVALVDEILDMHHSAIKPSWLIMWKNTNDETTLHISAKRGHPNIVGALIGRAKTLDRENLESGVRLVEELIRAVDKHGDTALHLAVRNKHAQVVKILVEEDPDFEYPLNELKESPLYLAVENDDHEMVDSILTTCKSPAYGGPCDRNALHAAVLQNCEDCTRLLLEHNQSLTQGVDEFGWTPLHYACRLNLVARARQLLKADRYAAYIMAHKDDNKTPFHVAASEDNKEVMITILEYCPDIWEITTIKGQNILHLALDNRTTQPLQRVLLWCCKSTRWVGNLINEKDDNGDTSLHALANSVTAEPIKDPLLQHPEANPNAYNANNLTPRDFLWYTKVVLFIKLQKMGKIVRFGGRFGLRDTVQKDNYWRERRKDYVDTINNPKGERDTHLIVAALIATVTFAAGFTVPGGFDTDKGPNKGKAILTRKAAFYIFIGSNTAALISSMLVIFLYYASTSSNDRKKIATSTEIMFVSTVAMMVAFSTGMFCVLTPFLGIAVCFFCSLAILIFLAMGVMMGLDDAGLELKKPTRHIERNSFFPPRSAGVSRL